MKEQCTRREFFIGAAKVIATAGAATVFMSASKKSAEKLTVDLSKDDNSVLTKVGGAILVDNPNKRKGIIVVYRKSESEILAFDGTCTHKGGPLSKLKDGELTCKWHKAKFNLEGKAIKGPAKKDLSQFPSMLEGSMITISLQ